MNTIKFIISPSEESNDHQVRIEIDGYDFLGDDYLGIDPPDFFKQEALLTQGKLLAGRCICGCEGCCDYSVNVLRHGNTVAWVNESGLTLNFDKNSYTKAVNSAKNDFSWETAARRAERHAAGLLKETKTPENYIFDWASARIKENTLVLSYSRRTDGEPFLEQKMFEINWDSKTSESAVNSVEKFIRETLKH